MQSVQGDLFTEIVHAIGGIRPVSAPITRETHIARDLGLDSVEVMDFVMNLEDQFDISIPLDKIAEVETVDDLCTTITQLRQTAGA